MAFTFNTKFTPSAPPSGATFNLLRITLTDAGGAVRVQDYTKADIMAAAVLQPDGSYLFPITYSTVAVGAYTVSAQCFDTTARPMGVAISGSGTVPLSDGVWFPGLVSFT